jgi:SnoaL-like domain
MSSGPGPADLLAAELGIRNTLARACHYLDNRQFREWADLFAEDAVNGTMRGREDIYQRISRAELARRPDLRRKHVIANSCIELSGDTAYVVSDILMFDLVAGGCTTRLGRYYDRLALVDGHWLFSERRLEWLDQQ